MSPRLEPTSDSQRKGHPTSYNGELELELGIGSPPAVVSDHLPEVYGRPLFEVLLVDPRYLFISWEVTTGQMQELQARLPSEQYQARKLVVKFMLDGPNGETVNVSELYGEAGRWFIELGRPGANIYASLGYEAGAKYYEFNCAGPLAIPRDTPVEPTEYQELRVAYGLGQHGELVLLGLRHKSAASWPDITLPPGPYESVLPPQPGAAVAGTGLVRPAPSSLELAPSSFAWPSSPRKGFEGGDR